MTIAMVDAIFKVIVFWRFFCINADKVICCNTNIVVDAVQMNSSGWAES